MYTFISSVKKFELTMLATLLGGTFPWEEFERILQYVSRIYIEISRGSLLCTFYEPVLGLNWE